MSVLNNSASAIALVPPTFADVQGMALVLAGSNLVPEALRGNEANIAFAIETGRELGIPPMQAIRGIHVIQGKPYLSADLMVAVVKRSSVCEYFRTVEATTTSVTVETKRFHEDPVRVTWTIEDAKRAALTGKDNWRLYPRAMLKARARAELARDVYPDVVAGLYDPDEAPPPKPKHGATDAEFTFKASEPERSIDGIEVKLIDNTTAPATISHFTIPNKEQTPADNYAAEYEAKSDVLRSELDGAFHQYLVDVSEAPNLATLDKIAGSSPAKPQKGTPEYDLASTAYKRRRALLLASKTP